MICFQSTFVLSLCALHAHGMDIIYTHPEMVYYNEPLIPYAAVYNGTLSLTQTATDKPQCNKADLNIANYSMLIGPQDIRTYKDGDAIRAAYDSNPFWFFLSGAWSASSGWSKNNTKIDLISSIGGYNKTSSAASGDVFWNITARAAGDGWDISAAHSLTTPLGNRFNLDGCGQDLRNWKIQTADNWTMTGHLTPSSIKLAFGPADWTSSGKTYGRHWVFEGTWDPDSANLVPGPDINIEGANKRFVTSSSTSGKARFEENAKSSSSTNGGVGRSSIISGTGFLTLLAAFVVAML